MNALTSFHTHSNSLATQKSSGRDQLTRKQVKVTMTDVSETYDEYTKLDDEFKDTSRQEDADLIRKAFPYPTQALIAEKAHEKIGWSEREIIRWLQKKHDMPSRAVKLVKMYIDAVEGVASRIEGK